MRGRRLAAEHGAMTTTPAPTKNTAAFFAQAGLSFGIALVGLIFAIIYLPVDPWIRAFLAMTALFLVSSSFTLAKVVRDAQDDKYLVNKVDEARLEKLLSEQDRFSVSSRRPASSGAAPS
jgi:hypothetical protein